MGNLGTTYNDANAPTETKSNNFEPIPAGWYPVEFEKTAPAQNKNGSGESLEMTCRVYGPNHAGRMLFPKITLRYIGGDEEKNELVEGIGRQQIQELRIALGIANLTDSSQIVGKRCMARVSIRPANGQWEARNDVKGYRALEGVAVITATAASTSSAAKKPWEK